MNTIEGNKIIQRFMGSIYTADYEKSWNALMPVVEKIESLGDYQIEIDLYSCYVIETSKLVTPEKCFVVESHYSSKIEAVWQAVIQFIEWYNSEQSVKESDTTKAT